MSVVLQLRIGSDRVHGEVLRRRKRVWAGEAAFTGPAGLQEAISSLAAESGIPACKLRLRVELERPLVQVRSLREVPPVGSQALRILVANQAHRFFRRNGARLETDAAWTRRRWGRSSGPAIAAATEERWLDAITAGADAAGLRLETVGPAPELSGARLELIPAAERARRRRRELLALRRLVTLAGALWLVACSLAAARFHRERRGIDREITVLEAPAAALLKLRREMAEATLMVEAVARADQERATVLRRLAAITAALPDSAYLSSIAVDHQGRGTITGAAPHGMLVVAALDREGAAVAPHLAGPAVREATAGARRERFTIQFGAPGVR